MIFRGCDGELDLIRDGSGNTLGFGTCDDQIGCGFGPAWMRAFWSKGEEKYKVLCYHCRQDGNHHYA